MGLVLVVLQWSECFVYLDDVIVLGCTFEEHVRNICSVFQQLHGSGLRLKLSKCSFYQCQVQYLGHIVSSDGVATYPQKVATWPNPKSKCETR